jgi:hypothetical protein
MTMEIGRQIAAVLWTREPKFILHVKDNGCDEKVNVHAVDPHAATAPCAGAPPSRDLTYLNGVCGIGLGCAEQHGDKS